MGVGLELDEVVEEAEVKLGGWGEEGEGSSTLVGSEDLNPKGHVALSDI